ncbi:LysR family transcriptional regulator [Pseudonocardia sulfidoxydans NBRC 16205]|uniref:LysR family transcriptional regulator n=1 Tax=Pseudonocardia sulfidoxydans NBRC 16205 TaxID=1223511 RepID=A0A511D8U5_9PSEU|nr:LysR family transcriptional regulator [Pseudonocardia sulfidoxydans]GEL21206.1 LysR family transcriptional regulator [Pseudonocardia sulfidoxydans NBRC 16205]
MELRELRSFVAVAEELHFGRAATRLGLVQPAVSQHLGRLERELGLRLLERSPHRVALTAAGRQLLAEVRAALAAIDRVRDVADTIGRRLGHTIRIGTTPGLDKRLADGVTALYESAPGSELVLVEGDAVANTAGVASGALDAALVRGTGPGGVVVGHDPISLIVPAAHDTARMGAVPFAALSDLRLRLPARRADPVLHDAVLGWCAATGVVPRRGRDVVSVDDAALEIGTGGREWTAVHGDTWHPATCSVVLRPADPALTVPIRLLLPPDARCTDVVVEAFRPRRGDNR